MADYNKWCSIWGNAVSIATNRPEGYSKDITIRYRTYSPFGGSGVRCTFDNFCGQEPVTITAACIRINDQCKDLYFEGKTSYVMQPGCHVVTDPVDIDVQPGDVIRVSFYLGDYTQMRSAVYVSGPRSGGRYALGNCIHDDKFDIYTSKNTNNVYFLSNVSVLTTSEAHSILCYGDSITAQDWPDYLGLRAEKLGCSNTSVIRKATSGSRILRQYSGITYDSYGLMSTKRFPHELPQDGVDTIILQQGINDIIHPVGVEKNPFRPMSDLPTASELIDGFKWYIEEARKLNLKVYAGTLLPIKGWRTYEGFREDIRTAFNEFLLTTDLLDGCIDFAKALEDPKDPFAFDPIYDSGDHLHPNSLGYKRMAETAAEVLFK